MSWTRGVCHHRARAGAGTGQRLARTLFDGLAPGAARTFAVRLTRRQGAALSGRRPGTVTASIRTGAKTGTARRLELR